MKKIGWLFLLVMVCMGISCKEEDLSKAVTVSCNGKGVSSNAVELSAQAGSYLEIRIKNTSSSYPATLTGIAVSDESLLQIQSAPMVVSAESEVSFRVVFNGTVKETVQSEIRIAYKIGAYSSSVVIPVKIVFHSDDPAVSLLLVEPEKAYLDFGVTAAGTLSDPQKIVIRNGSDSSFEADVIEVQGSDAFFIGGEGSALVSRLEKVVFEPLQTREFPVYFYPMQAIPDAQAVFSVSSADGIQTVALSGSATAPEAGAAVLSIIKDGQPLQSGAVCTFPEVSVGSDAVSSIRLEIKNASAETPVTVSSIDINPPGPFSCDRKTFSIAASSSEFLTVSFSPEKAADYESRLLINADASNWINGRFELNLTGTAVLPRPEMQLKAEGLVCDPSGNGNFLLEMPATVFEPQPVSVFRDIEVMNTGDADLIVTSIRIPENSGLSVNGNQPLTVAAGESAIVRITYLPPSGNDLHEVISIVSNSGGAETVTDIAVTSKIASRLPLLPPVIGSESFHSLDGMYFYTERSGVVWTVDSASGSCGKGLFSYTLYEGMPAGGSSVQSGQAASGEDGTPASISLTASLTDGRFYSLTVTDSDAQGNVSEEAVFCFYVDWTLPSKPESVVLDSAIASVLRNGVVYTAASDLKWIWTVPESGSDVPNNHIKRSEYRFLNGESLMPLQENWTSVSVGEASLLSAQDQMPYAVEVRFEDDFGRYSESSVSQPVFVDRRRPSAPADLALKNYFVTDSDGTVMTYEKDLIWGWSAVPDAVAYRWRVGDGSWRETAACETSAFSVTEGGLFTVEVKAVNDLRLESDSAFAGVKVSDECPDTVLEGVDVRVAAQKHKESDADIWYVDDPNAVLSWNASSDYSYRYTINEGEWFEAVRVENGFETAGLEMAADGEYSVAVYAVNRFGNLSEKPQLITVSLLTSEPQLKLSQSSGWEIEVDVWSDIRDRWNGSNGILSQMGVNVSADGGRSWHPAVWGSVSACGITVSADDQALLKALNRPGADKSVYDYDNPDAEVNTKTVVLTATGRFGKTDSKTVTVFLKDTTPPVITDPNQVFEYGSQNNFSIIIRDNSGKYDGTAKDYPLTYGGYKAGYVAGTMKFPFEDSSGNTSDLTITVNPPSTENMVGNGNFKDITDTDKITDSNTSGLTFGTPTGWGFNSAHSHFAYGGDGGTITGITYYYKPFGINKNPLLVCGAINNGTKYGYMTLSRWSDFNNTNVEIYTTESNTAASKTLYEGVEYELSYRYKDYTISTGIGTFTNGATVSVSKRSGSGQFASADSFSLVRTPQASGTAWVKDALNQSFDSQSGKVKITGGDIAGFTVTYVYGNTEGIRYTENYCGSIMTDVSFKAVDWPKIQSDGTISAP